MSFYLLDWSGKNFCPQNFQVVLEIDLTTQMTLIKAIAKHFITRQISFDNKIKRKK
jgi:hypothetical protein